MDNFLFDISYVIYQKYVCQFLPFKYNVRYEKTATIITHVEDLKQYYLYFWNNNIVEFRVLQGNINCYYLHFEFTNYNNANELFGSFLRYCLLAEKKNRIKVLICCSGGYTSSYFAEGIMRIITKKHDNIDVFASSYTKLFEESGEYDLILIAPQMRYIVGLYKNYINLVVIPTNLYATYDFDGGVDLIINELYSNTKTT